MRILRIRVSNFKSFSSEDVCLGSFSIFIGGNASGKSNFVTILKFLRDVQKFGLQNAIAAQGGKSSISNLTIGTSKPLRFEIQYSYSEHPTLFKILTESSKKATFYGMPLTDLTYTLKLKFSEKWADRWRFHETYKLKGVLHKYSLNLGGDIPTPPKIIKKGVAAGSISYINENGRYRVKLDLDNKKIDLEEQDLTIPYWAGRDSQFDLAKKTFLESGLPPLMPNLSKVESDLANSPHIHHLHLLRKPRWKSEVTTNSWRRHNLKNNHLQDYSFLGNSPPPGRHFFQTADDTSTACSKGSEIYAGAMNGAWPWPRIRSLSLVQQWGQGQWLLD